MSSPGTPTSLGSSMDKLSISKTREMLTSQSNEVKLFSFLFKQSNPDEQAFYIDQFFQYMPAEIYLKKHYTSTTKSGEDNKANAISCVKKFLMDTETDVCTGFGAINSIKQELFITFRKFLDNFKFPLFSSTMSLPQLQLLSMLIFSNSEPKSVSNCKFMVNDVDFDSVSNIAYEGDPGTLVKNVKNVKELLDFLQSIGIINNVITRNFNLGKMSSSAIIPGIEADVGLKFDNTYFVFELENSENNRIIITMKLGTTEGTVTNCSFVVIKVDQRNKTETYKWDCKINNMTFYHRCKGGATVSATITGDISVGGSSKRRYSKSTNKTKRDKRVRRTQRRNIKKNKSRRKYGKARNTKRKLRRFRH
jgi:hypothetical protein